MYIFIFTGKLSEKTKQKESFQKFHRKNILLKNENAKILSKFKISLSGMSPVFNETVLIIFLIKHGAAVSWNV